MRQLSVLAAVVALAALTQTAVAKQELPPPNEPTLLADGESLASGLDYVRCGPMPKSWRHQYIRVGQHVFGDGWIEEVAGSDYEPVELAGQAPRWWVSRSRGVA